MNPAFLDEVQRDQKTPVPEQDLFRLPLREQINLKHPLVRLTELINWERLGALMRKRFVSGKARKVESLVGLACGRRAGQ